MSMQWLIYALLSALTAALVAIFARVGLQGVDSITATGVRAGVMFGAIVVLMLVTGRMNTVANLDSNSLFYIVIGGLAGALSWVFYFFALEYGKVSQVVSIDRLSIAFAIIFAVIFLGEKLTLPTILGVALIITGGILIALT
ncbi:MAG: EamA family transporter [Candidatus Bathyarchaeota archaeon]